MKPEEMKKVKDTDLIIKELLLLSRVHRVRREDDTADLLEVAAERLSDLTKIAEHYRRKAEKKRRTV